MGNILDNDVLWQKCVEFHGHECRGLAIGYKAGVLAMKKMNLDRASDEELVCIAENDSCSIDGIQVMTGCTCGKGNLILHLKGKQAFSFYKRGTGISARFVFKGHKGDLAEMLSTDPEELFEIKATNEEIPEEARIFKSYDCDVCKESTAEYFLRMQDGKKVCPDCFNKYDRFEK